MFFFNYPSPLPNPPQFSPIAHLHFPTNSEGLKTLALSIFSQRFSPGLVTTRSLTITYFQDLCMQDIFNSIHLLGSLSPVLESKSMEKGVSVNLMKIEIYFTFPGFYFILIDSPIIGRVTATSWRQSLRARNSAPPSPSPSPSRFCPFSFQKLLKPSPRKLSMLFLIQFRLNNWNISSQHGLLYIFLPFF